MATTQTERGTEAPTDPSLASRHHHTDSEPEEGTEDLGLIDSVCHDRTVLLNVAWAFPTENAISQGQPDYLDGSCLIYSQERLLDIVDFRGAHSAAVGCHNSTASSASYEWSAGRGKAAAVLHSGDVMSTEGGFHVIRLLLAKLPDIATDCFFAVSAYNCRDLSLFRSLNVRLVDDSTPVQTLAKISISDVPPLTSCMIVGGLRRRLNVWRVLRLVKPCDATVRNYSPIEASLKPLQENQARWQRRRTVVMLAQLWQTARAFPSSDPASGMKARLGSLDILQVMRLPTMLFQYIVQYI
mmetsp:Transcript_11110/g.24112  ORF Transcript_11110/g.24112 Transcript_11110/m.24112 type:complete len:298 (-) Transcript_11110:175-1068(-)